MILRPRTDWRRKARLEAASWRLLAALTLLAAQATTSPRAIAAEANASQADESDPARSSVSADATSPIDSAVDRTTPRNIELREFLIVPRIGRYGRSPVHVDPVAAAFALAAWKFPSPDDVLRDADGSEHRWKGAAAEEDGWLRGPALRGGYAATSVKLDADATYLLEAMGHVMVYVNGEPRAGDPYSTGRTVTPVGLRKGVNELVFHVAAGALRARLLSPTRDVALDLRDAQLPDLVVGEAEPLLASVLVVNARDTALVDAQLTTVRSGGRIITAAVGSVPPFAVRKVVAAVEGSLTQDEAGSEAVRVQLDLTLPGDHPQARRRVVDTAAFDLGVVQPHQLQSRTFLSRIDGSVQSYAFLGASQNAAGEGGPQPGLLAALHPAGVSAVEAMQRVTATPWAHIVAPGGRRPYGFDWEDWSREDLFEAMRDVRVRNPYDDRRVWLMGEGVGGHGALRIAALAPDRFAALASFGGWISFHTYGGSVPDYAGVNDPLLNMHARCAGVTRTLPILGNLAACGIYVCHAADDEDVAVGEARRLRSRLADFHGDFAYREVQGFERVDPLRAASQGHEPASFVFSRTQPDNSEVDQIEFVTFDPAQSSGNHWLQILQQQRQFKLSQATIACDVAQRQFHGVTKNVKAVALDVAHLAPGGAVNVALDGQASIRFPWPDGDRQEVVLVRRGSRWGPSLD